MYLKSLTLKGFKSFADRSLLSFDPGLNVVVGPNGSGKSNVSDAILWVLGEQSAKQLRGQAMEDVIFSGSSVRPAVGVAEVTLVLDNSAHELPVDFDEVAVTRRMYRSGESEYLINSSPSRLMDIQDILHDSGLGKDTHSIISQGKLDSVLNSRPEDLRPLVEEAAGISKHRRRKERSTRKLKAMEESVRRARDLDREMRRRLRPLERQVDKAQRYADLESERQRLETLLAVDDLRRLQAEWQALGSQRAEAEAAVELARYRSEEKAKNLEKLQSLLGQKGLFVGDLGEQRRRVQDQLGRLRSDMGLLEEKGRNMVARLSDTRMNLSSLDRRHDAAFATLAEAQQDLQEAKGRHQLLSGELESLAPAAKKAAQDLADLDSQAAQLVADQRIAQRASDEAVLARARLQEQVANAKAEDDLFAQRMDAISETLEASEAELTSLRASLIEHTRAIEEARDDVSAAEKHQASSSRALSEARAAQDKTQGALREAQASLKALKSVATPVAATSRMARIQEDAALKALAAHTVASELHLCPSLEKAAEGYLAAGLQDIVASTPQDAQALISCALAAAKASGDVTVQVAPTDGGDAPKAPACMPASGAAPFLEEMASQGLKAGRLEGRLFSAVAVVEDARRVLESHLAEPRWSYVSRDGAVVAGTDGRVRVGLPAGTDRGALERNRRIHELEDSLPQLEEAQKEASAAVAAARQATDEARRATEAAKSQLSSFIGEESSLRREVARLEQSQQRSQAELKAVSERRAKAAEKTADATPRISELDSQVKVAEAQLDQLASQIAEAEERRRDLAAAEAEARANANERSLELATMDERIRHLSVTVDSMGRELESLERQRVAAVESTRSLEVLRLRIDPLHERYEAIHERVLQWAERLRDTASLAEADSDSLKRTINDAKAESAAAAKELEEATSALNALLVEAGKLEVQVQTAVEAVRAAGSMPIEEALELPAPEDRAADEAALARTKSAIEHLGPVNQVAMEEYRELKERADYIAAQLADLESAKGALDKITSAIDRKMRRAFLETFATVNGHFEEIFSMLFPGGMAHLELTDPDHPDQTGIEIVAQPKGKRIPKLALMSGGEKSLTALALLFAVYRTRTVPFYVFDEVEAALDDSNLGKLLGAIEVLKESTQLIVISHQRRTMEQADVLYGVSMQADGVSRVVSQRLDQRTGKVVDV